MYNDARSAECKKNLFILCPWFQFGSDSKVQMEYWWENVPPDTGPNIVPSAEAEIASDPLCTVGETLQKLISIAKLNFTKAKVS